MDEYTNMTFVVDISQCVECLQTCPFGNVVVCCRPRWEDNIKIDLQAVGCGV